MQCLVSHRLDVRSLALHFHGAKYNWFVSKHNLLICKGSVHLMCKLRVKFELLNKNFVKVAVRCLSAPNTAAERC